VALDMASGHVLKGRAWIKFGVDAAKSDADR
jgi:hypothetical protein